MISSVVPRQRPRAAALCALLVAGTTTLAGCGLFGGSSGTSTYSGPAVPAGSPRSGQQAAASPSASGGAGSAGQSTQKPYVDTVKKGTCSPSTFVRNAGLVRGAITTYITTPLSSSATSAKTARAAVAASYAARQLGAGVKSVESCPTAKALAGVGKQNVTALTALATALRSGTVDRQKVDAVDALFGDVTTQAARLKLTITSKTPAVSELS